MKAELFTNLEQIKFYYDDVCERYNRPKVIPMIINDRRIDYIGVCESLRPYYIKFCDGIFDIVFTDLDEKHHLPDWIHEDIPEDSQYKYILHASDYVIFHEIFHHISGLMDGKNFEYQLGKFILQEMDGNISRNLKINQILNP